MADNTKEFFDDIADNAALLWSLVAAACLLGVGLAGLVVRGMWKSDGNRSSQSHGQEYTGGPPAEEQVSSPQKVGKLGNGLSLEAARSAAHTVLNTAITYDTFKYEGSGITAGAVQDAEKATFVDSIFVPDDTVLFESRVQTFIRDHVPDRQAEQLARELSIHARLMIESGENATQDWVQQINTMALEIAQQEQKKLVASASVETLSHV